MSSQSNEVAKKANAVLECIKRHNIQITRYHNSTAHCIGQVAPGVLYAVSEVSLQNRCGQNAMDAEDKDEDKPHLMAKG